jgi:hypothetical protein
LSATNIGAADPVDLRYTSSQNGILRSLLEDRHYRVQVRALDVNNQELASVATFAKTLGEDDPSHSQHFTHVAQNGQFWTGLAIVNGTDQSSGVRFEAFNESGESLGVSRIQELGGGQKLLFTADRLFEGSLKKGDISDVKRVLLTSDQPLMSLELFGDHNQTQMGGVPSDDDAVSTAILIAESQGATAFGLANPSENQSLVLQATGFNEAGVEVARGQIYLAPKRQLASLLGDIFPDQNTSLDEIKWVRLKSEKSFFGFALAAEEEVLSGTPLLSTGALETVIPAYIARQPIHIVNIDSSTNRIEVQLFSADGQLISTRNLSFDPNQYRAVAFPVSGSIKILSQSPCVAQSHVQKAQGNGEKLSEILIGQGDFHDALMFPHIASNDLFETDVIVFNNSTRESALRLEPFTGDGEPLPSINLSVPANGALNQSIQALFPAIREQIGYLIVRGPVGDQLVASGLFYTKPGLGGRMGGYIPKPPTSN